MTESSNPTTLTNDSQALEFDTTPDTEDPEFTTPIRDYPTGRWFPTERRRKSRRLYQRCRVTSAGDLTVDEMWKRVPDDTDERPRQALAFSPRRAARYNTIGSHIREDERPMKRRRLGLFCLYYIEALDALVAEDGRGSGSLSELTTGLYRHPLNTWAKTDIMNTFALIQEGEHEWWTWTGDLEGHKLPTLTDSGRRALAKAERELPALTELAESGIETTEDDTAPATASAAVSPEDRDA